MEFELDPLAPSGLTRVKQIVGGPTGALTVSNDSISNAKLANMAGHTVKARTGGSSGDPEDLSIGSHDVLGRNGGDISSLSAGNNSVLRRNTGNSLEFGEVGTDHFETSVNTSLGLADTALQNLSGLDTDDLAEGTTNLYSQWEEQTYGTPDYLQAIGNEGLVVGADVTAALSSTFDGATAYFNGDVNGSNNGLNFFVNAAYGSSFGAYGAFIVNASANGTPASPTQTLDTKYLGGMTFAGVDQLGAWALSGSSHFLPGLIARAASDVTSGVMESDIYLGSLLQKMIGFETDTNAIKFNEAQLDSDITFYHDTGTAMFIQGSDGKVGVGTSAPTHSLTFPSTSTGIALYNTADQTTNYEGVRLYWSGDIAYLRTVSSGTGSLRNFNIGNTNTNMLISSGQGSATVGAFSITRFMSVDNATVLNVAGQSNNSSGIARAVLINPIINQSSTAGYTALLINPTETATGSGAKNLIDAQVGGVSKFKVDNAGDVEITDSTKGIILTSPDASRWRVTVDNTGSLTTTEI